ncbi:MAG: hypothetical protein WDA16_12125 [Candidatus Thermoplasmatota archaeon]
MSDNYDPLTTQTAAITFRRLDALQDSIAAFGKTTSGAPVAILVATDGTLQTRRLNRLSDEVILIGTDPAATARPVLVDTQGRLSSRPLSALPITDFDALRAYFLGPAAAQIQGKADADGTLNVNDPAGRASLASILAQLDVTQSALRDAITGASPSARSLFGLGQDLVGAIQATQPRSIVNLPSEYPDPIAQARLLSILGQLDITQTAHRDAIIAAVAADQARHLTNFPADYPDATAQTRLQSVLTQLDRTLSEVFDVKAAQNAVTAGANTAGLTVTLDLGTTGRPTVQRFISVGGASTVLVQASRDGATWRTIETQTFAVATTNVAAVQGFGYRYVRLTSATAAVALEFEVSGAR